MSETIPPLPHRKLCRRYNDPGHAHFLTFSCFKRQPFLARDRARNWFVDGIHRGLEIHAFHLWAYVIMPEHAHLLVWPSREVYEISAFLKSIKQSVSKKAVAYVRRVAPAFLPRMLDSQPNGKETYRFWQRGGGYDRNLWSWNRIWDKIDYIHSNPVKRSLCARPEDWHYSSAADYLGLRNGPLPIDLTFLPPDPRK
jgi:putative transposase